MVEVFNWVRTYLGVGIIIAIRNREGDTPEVLIYYPGKYDLHNAEWSSFKPFGLRGQKCWFHRGGCFEAV